VDHSPWLRLGRVEGPAQDRSFLVAGALTLLLVACRFHRDWYPRIGIHLHRIGIHLHRVAGLHDLRLHRQVFQAPEMEETGEETA
jgi:hypothetical protein